MSKESDKPQDSTNADSVSDKGEKSEHSQANPSYIKRRPPWQSSYAALKYISKIPRNNFRRSDKITGILASLVLLAMVALMYAPVYVLKLPVLCGFSFVFTLIIISYIGNRLGVLAIVPERQAILVWEIILGSLILGVLLTFNVMLAAAYLKQLIPGIL